MTYQTTEYGVDRHVSRRCRPNEMDQLTSIADGAEPYGTCYS